VEKSNVTEPYERLGVVAYGVKVDVIGDAVRALPSSGRDDGPDARVTEGVVEIGQAVLIGTRQIVAELVEHVLAQFHHQTPRSQSLHAPAHDFPVGCAGRRHDPDSVARLQPRTQQR
jgi:hypothetical protein